MTTPRASGYRMPAEWQAHASTWLAWPSAAHLWEEDLLVAQAEHADLCRELAQGETLDVLVPDAEAEATARSALFGLDVRLHRIPFGDIWLRDIAPIFLQGPGGVASVRFAFNGWGGKYVLPHDAAVAHAIQQVDGRASFASGFVLEGGSVDVDGEGTVLTTRQCLLHPNRNGVVDEATCEAILRDHLGAERVLWLDEGLLHDHTDGHVDTIARFIAPGVVACMAPSGFDDPNREVLDTIARDLGRMSDAAGRRLEVVRIPSPGLVLDEDGDAMPASHVNFYIANACVAVPIYGTPWDEAAVEALRPWFPGRKVVGLSARAILTGGGAFHCISQQVPLGGVR